MEALKSHSPCRVSSSSASSIVRDKDAFMSRLETCFLRTRKVSGFGLLGSIFVQQSRVIYPVSCVSPKTQVEFEEVDLQTEDEYQSKTVCVKFQLEKECLFGQQFLMVGDDAMFGLWDPKSAVPLTWSDRHVWFAEMDIPVGKTIQYKFILKDGSGKILWQPGPDRVFQVWETNNLIVVSDDWENAELHVITEEEKNASPSESSETVLDVNNNSAIADNEFDLSKLLLVEPSHGQTIVDSVPPLQEKPKSLVAESTSYTKNVLFVSSGPEGVSEKRVNSTSESFFTSSRNDVVVTEEILGNNGRAAKTDVVSYEGEPVLVPGLPPFPELSTEEHDYNKVGERISPDDLVEAFETKDHSLPETQLDEREQQCSNQPQKGTPERQKLESEMQQKPNYANIDKQSESEAEDGNDILLNDLQWGQKTLLKFLTNFGLF